MIKLGRAARLWNGPSLRGHKWKNGARFRPVARIFYGGGGGAYLKNSDQIINVWIICHGTSGVTREESVEPTVY